MDNYNIDKLSSIDLRIDKEVKQELTEAAKWTKFISISVFVICAIMLLGITIGGSTLISLLGKVNSPLIALAGFSGGVFIAIISVIMAVISVVYYFLYRFSIKIKMAISTENNFAMNEAFLH